MKKLLFASTSILIMLFACNSLFANCGGSVWFGHWYPDQGKLVLTPGQNLVDSTLVGEWWAYNFGKATKGVGHDRGSHLDNTTASWLLNWSGNEWYASGDWGNSGVDGCVADAPPGPNFGQMVMLVEDYSADSKIAYFMVAATEYDVDWDQYDFSRTAPGYEQLIPIPEPSVTSSVKNPTSGYDITLTWSRPTNGFYISAGAGLTDADILKKYEVYWKSGTTEPTDRLASNWEKKGESTTESATVNVPGDGWIALRLVFEGTSGTDPFMTRYVGQAKQ
ncbi:MAG: hypothetical protein AB1297_05500, partial [bacterium]